MPPRIVLHDAAAAVAAAFSASRALLRVLSVVVVLQLSVWVLWWGFDQVRIWRRAGKEVDRQTAEHLFEVINSREDVLRRLIRKCAYLKYVEARLGDRILYADEILRDGFCVNMIDTPLCPLKVVTNLQEAVWDADIVIAGLPSTEIRHVFQQVGRYWRERRTMPIIISLAKGVEAALQPHPHIITPTQMIVETSTRFLCPIYRTIIVVAFHGILFLHQLSQYAVFLIMFSIEI